MTTVINSWFDDEGFILSNILAYLKWEEIYRAERVNKWWSDIISKGYFFSELFDLDKILRQNVIDDRIKKCFGKLYPRQYSYSMKDLRYRDIVNTREELKKEQVLQLFNHMIKKHGSVQRVSIVQMYQLLEFFFNGYEEVLHMLAMLFPNITVLHVGITTHGYRDFMPQFVDLCVSEFKHLNQFYLVDGNILKCAILPNTSKEMLQQKQKQYPNVEFPLLNVVIEGKEVEWLLKTPAYRTDEQLLSLLESNPWLIEVNVGSENFLIAAIKSKFNKSIAYLLDKKPDLLLYRINWRGSSFEERGPLLLAIDSLNILEMLAKHIEVISHKSDQFLKEMLPCEGSVSSFLHPMSIVMRDSRIYQHLEQNFNIDNRIIHYQTMYTVQRPFSSHEIFNTLPDNRVVLGENTPLHDLCASDYQTFTKKIHEYNPEILAEESFKFNSFGASILHCFSVMRFITRQHVRWISIQN